MLIVKYEKGRVQRKRAGGSTLLNQPRQIAGCIVCVYACTSVLFYGIDIEILLMSEARNDC